MNEPKWLRADVLEALHDRQLAEHGGSSGIRDRGLFDSALAFPRNQFAYGETDIFMLAAGYSFSLIRNHAFVDGNKRIAFIAGLLFLSVNGYRIVADEAEAVLVTLDLAKGMLGQKDFAVWLKQKAVAR